MQQKLLQRLEELKTEFESGQKIWDETNTKQTNLRETLLRIGGAIQVLEEMLKPDEYAEHENVSKVSVMEKTAS